MIFVTVDVHQEGKVHNTCLQLIALVNVCSAAGIVVLLATSNIPQKQLIAWSFVLAAVVLLATFSVWKLLEPKEKSRSFEEEEAQQHSHLQSPLLNYGSQGEEMLYFKSSEAASDSEISV